MKLKVYPDDIFEKLGFTKILQQIKSFCYGSTGARLVEDLFPLAERKRISLLLNETTELNTLLSSGQNFPLGNYEEIDNPLRLLKIPNSILEADDWVKIRSTATMVSGLVEFLSKQKDEAPGLHHHTESLDYFDSVITEINEVLDHKGEVKSSVSRDLENIREGIHSRTMVLDKKFRGILIKARDNGWLSKEEESFRQGRRVLAIIAEHKRKIPGAILDESATGKTFFVEPRETYDINNEIVELRQDEKREIRRVLKGLTEELRPFEPFIRSFQNFIGLMDLTYAKTRFAQRINAVSPQLVSENAIDLRNAFHPLLLISHSAAGKETVPLDLNLDKDKRILVISGPNAGGKSVALKTTGLLQLMVQSGIPIPASPESSTGVFSSFFAEIGDDQSIENDLSTYSSHLKHMDYFVRNSDGNSLFLIDEFGTGTDPQFGGAIAESVLKRLKDNGAYGVVTTHYSNLKVFASAEEGIENGSMVFDLKNLAPTFQLSIGKPGSSYSFEIARKTGLDERIIEQAKKTPGKELRDFDKILNELEVEKLLAEKREAELERSQKQLNTLLERYSRLKEELEQSRKTIIRESKQKALEHINLLNRKFENMVREWREQHKEKTDKSFREVSGKIREQQKFLQREVDKMQPASPKNETIIIGDTVKLKGGNVVGTVEKIEKGKAIINFGKFTTEAGIGKIEKSSATPDHEKANSLKIDYSGKASRFTETLDLRGKRVEEALNDLEDWLDKALLLDKHQLKIIHGKGEGKLRPAIRNFLRKYHNVSNIQSESEEFGGDGVTLFRLE